ncbi:hypothetical protein IEO21_07118 [Rhodonia placenta]|uniref:Uncharacterized protein n=1 Tax=Rhodonia placenta TaxID=104341 RepID=A0A8H7NYM2_9APHY|nr:hypothetical protein IEO21_07118 [Postia placenta]
MNTLLRLAASENANRIVHIHVLYKSLSLPTSSCTELLSVCGYIHFCHLSGAQPLKASMSAFS